MHASLLTQAVPITDSQLYEKLISVIQSTNDTVLNEILNRVSNQLAAFMIPELRHQQASEKDSLTSKSSEKSAAMVNNTVAIEEVNLVRAQINQA